MENTQITNYSFGWLVRHIWDVLILRTGSRISRWEYFLASGFLGIIATVIIAVFMLIYRLLVNESASIWSINIMWIILAIIYLICFIWGLKLWVKRLKDLNMSPWWIVFSILPLVLLIVMSRANAATVDPANLVAWANKLLVILFFLSALITLIISLMMLFKKWTSGVNQYGVDPLDHQSRSNANYWWLFLAVGVLNFLITNVTWLNESMERAILRGLGVDPAQVDMMQDDIMDDLSDNIENTIDEIRPEDTTMIEETRLADPSLTDTVTDTPTVEVTTDDSSVVIETTTPTEEVPVNPAWDDSTTDPVQ